MSGWVCPECGLDYDTILPKDGATALAGYPRRYRELFPPRDDDEKPDGVIRRRPEPAVWSAIEYACHVADVEDTMAEAFVRMVNEDSPTINWGWDADERAVSDKYNEQARDAVLQHVETACQRASDAVKKVPNDAWDRTATFDWGERDLLTMMRNAVHEGYHHLRDIEKVLQRVVGRPG